MANVKDVRYVRIGLHLRLCGVAHEWYAVELKNIQRGGMKGGHNITNWVIP